MHNKHYCPHHHDGIKRPISCWRCDMTFIKRGSAIAVCFSRFYLQIVLEGGVCVCLCVWVCACVCVSVAGGNNLVAELNLHLVQQWHLQQPEKSSSPNFYELWNKNKPSADRVTERCASRCDTFALRISSESKLLSKDMRQTLKGRQ